MSARKKKKASTTNSGESVKLSEPLQQCLQILKFIQGKTDAQPFLEPVDWETFNLHDYPEIIKKPMDLGTIQTRLESGKYNSPDKFAADMRLVWKNAMTYNRSESEIFLTAEALSKLFEKKFSKIKKPTKRRASDMKAEPSSPSSNPQEGSTSGHTATAHSAATHQGTAAAHSRSASSPSPSPSSAAGMSPPSSSGGSTSASSAGPREASRSDKMKFSQIVNHLDSDQLGDMVAVIQKSCPDAITEEDDEKVLEVEINSLDAHTLTTLLNFANNCIAEGNKKKKTKLERT